MITSHGSDLKAVACVIEGSLSSSGSPVAFFKAPSLASGGRTTLTWNRQVVSNGDSSPSTFRSTADLDLYLYDEADGSSDGSSRGRTPSWRSGGS